MTVWQAGAASAVGSLPGDDVGAACRLIFDELPDLPHIPELPGRGVQAGMVARTCALLVDMHVDLQPAGWRLVPGEGSDERRARSLLAADLDAVEEVAQDYLGPLKVQLAGPFTLASAVERPGGDRVLADYGARRDLAQSLAEGVVAHVDDVRRRVPGAQVVVQLDEPALPATLAGSIPTASGFSRHRAVEESEVRAGMSELVAAIDGASALSVVHTCGDELVVGALVTAGVSGLSFDAAKVRDRDRDALSDAVEQGVTLFVGAVPTVEPAQPPTDADITRTVAWLWHSLGFAEEDTAAGCVVTPACGLADATSSWARAALSLARRAGANLRKGE